MTIRFQIRHGDSVVTRKIDIRAVWFGFRVSIDGGEEMTCPDTGEITLDLPLTFKLEDKR